MGFLDDAKNKLTQAVGKHGGTIEKGLDKVADTINDKTGGKHADKVEKSVGKAKNALGKLDGKNDDLT